MLPLLLAARECSTVFVVSKHPPPAAVPNPPFLCQNFLCLTCNTLLVHRQLSSYRQLGENYFLGGRHRYYFSLNKNSSKKPLTSLFFDLKPSRKWQIQHYDYEWEYESIGGQQRESTTYSTTSSRTTCTAKESAQHHQEGGFSSLAENFSGGQLLPCAGVSDSVGRARRAAATWWAPTEPAEELQGLGSHLSSHMGWSIPTESHKG